MEDFLNKSDNVSKDFHEILSIISLNSRFIQDSKQKTNIKFFIDKTKNFYNIVLSSDTTKDIHNNLSTNNTTKNFHRKNISMYAIDEFTQKVNISNVDNENIFDNNNQNFFIVDISIYLIKS